MLTLDEFANYEKQTWTAPDGKGGTKQVEGRGYGLLASADPLKPEELREEFNTQRALLTSGPRSSRLKRPGEVEPAFLPALAAALVPVVAGFVVDQVQSRLQEEADKYEQQFGSTAVFDGFWSEFVVGSDKAKPEDVAKLEPVAATDGTALAKVAEGLRTYPAAARIWSAAPMYAAAEVRRTTLDGKGNRRDSSCALFLLIPSKSDPRLFLVHPFFYYAKTAKAKIASGSAMTAVIDLGVDSTWIDQWGRTVQERVAFAKLTQGGYDIKSGKPFYRTDPAKQAAGWFAGVPVSVDEHGDPVGAGVFRVTVNVTERDESKAKPVIERIGKFVGDQKVTVVKVVQEKVGGDQP